jgi:hypothetical protein
MARNLDEGPIVVRAPERSVREERPAARTRPMEEGRRRRGGLGWLVPLGLLLLGLLALALYFGLRDGGNDEAGSGGNAAVQQQGQDESGSPAGGGSAGAASGSAGAGAGTLTAGSRSLLPVPSATVLSGMVGQQVTGRSVPVESVVSNEAFWVGTSEQDRVFVRLERGSESPFQVRAGENVSFTGVLAQANAALAEKLGVTEAEGARLLARQGSYVDVKSGTLRSG